MQIESSGEAELIDAINEELGGWSLIQSESKLSLDNIFKKLVKFAKLSFKPLFVVYISLNPKNPKQYILRVRY